MERSPRVDRRGLLLALLQAGLVLGLGGQLLVERALRPRGWLRTEPVDPNLPIRGRYVDLAMEVPLEGESVSRDGSPQRLQLEVRQGRVVATALRDSAPPGEGWVVSREAIRRSGWGSTVLLPQRLAFFIPPEVTDPSQRPAGDPLWAEVTLPWRGPPRPIRLGQERNGRLEPLRP